MISDDHLQALATACRDSDQAALDRLAPWIGLAFQLAELGVLAGRTYSKLVSPLDLAKLALSALDAAHGLAVTIVKKPRRRSSTTPLHWECGLAVRSETSVVVGLRSSSGAPASAPKAWSELAPWSKELAKNRPTAERWASQTGEDRVRISIIARPKLVGTGTRMTEAELVREIVAHPDDEAPRLVLADLLIQREDVRGELIQLHHKLVTDELDDATRDALRARIDTLTTGHGARLAGEIAEHVSGYSTVGGFVSTVTMTATAFRKHGARVFAMQPIRRLILRPSSEKHVRLLAGASHLGELRALELGAYDSPPDVTLEPLRTVKLARLEELSLQFCRVLDRSESAIAQLDAPRLRKLRLRGGYVLPPSALRGLAANRQLAGSLEELSVSAWEPRNDVMADSIANEVFETLRFPNLQRLELDGCWFESDPRRIEKLVRRSPRLRSFVEVRSIDRGLVDAVLECRELECLEINFALDLEMLERALALPRLAILKFYGGSATRCRPLVERLLAVPATHPLRRVGIENYTFNPRCDPDGPLHTRFPWRPRNTR